MKHSFVCTENIIEGLDVNSDCLWEKGIGIWVEGRNPFYYEPFCTLF